MVSSDPISARPRGSQILPNSVVSGSERTVSRGTAAFKAQLEAAFWEGAKAEATLRVERRMAAVFMLELFMVRVGYWLVHRKQGSRCRRHA